MQTVGEGRWLATGLALLLWLWLLPMCGGCEEQGIRTYHAPKDPPGRDVRTQAAPSAAAPAPAPLDVTWTAPAEWQRASQPRAMRLATYFAGEGDARLEIAASVFPGDVGGVLGNINRWRGQLGLGPVNEDQWRDHVESFGEPAGVHGWTLRLDAETASNELNADGMLAAIIHVSGADRTWFVRAVGDAAVLDAHQDDVFAFARTFKVEDTE